MPEDGAGQLDAEDYASVLAAAAAAGPAYSGLNEALARWRLVVVDIEAGFDLEFAWEYGHELRCRDWLRAAWPLLTERVRALRQPELDRWDDRFFAATLPMTVDDAGMGGRGGAWWHRRFPARCLRGEGQELPAHWSPPPVVETY
ncbi:hypothetical protein [Streptomyces sp. NPDC048603]|uniref:hypothetical protein n=1 Tax=Streptomyces sp. NPDC048603 TaxID=3365577 RepID=UPI00371FCF87